LLYNGLRRLLGRLCFGWTDDQEGGIEHFLGLADDLGGVLAFQRGDVEAHLAEAYPALTEEADAEEIGEKLLKLFVSDFAVGDGEGRMLVAIGRVCGVFEDAIADPYGGEAVFGGFEGGGRGFLQEREVGEVEDESEVGMAAPELAGERDGFGGGSEELVGGKGLTVPGFQEDGHGGFGGDVGTEFVQRTEELLERSGALVGSGVGSGEKREGTGIPFEGLIDGLLADFEGMDTDGVVQGGEIELSCALVRLDGKKDGEVGAARGFDGLGPGLWVGDPGDIDGVKVSVGTDLVDDLGHGDAAGEECGVGGVGDDAETGEILNSGLHNALRCWTRSGVFRGGIIALKGVMA